MESGLKINSPHGSVRSVTSFELLLIGCSVVQGKPSIPSCSNIRALLFLVLLCERRFHIQEALHYSFTQFVVNCALKNILAVKVCAIPVKPINTFLSGLPPNSGSVLQLRKH